MAAAMTVRYREREEMAARIQAQDHRASLAHAARREDNGEIIDRCDCCRTERHAVRCSKAAR